MDSGTYNTTSQAYPYLLQTGQQGYPLRPFFPHTTPIPTAVKAGLGYRGGYVMNSKVTPVITWTIDNGQ